MANKTLLNAVNDTLKRVSVIAGDSGALASLTDSARQVDIDVSVQVINEAIDELYSLSGVSHPNQSAESTIVLATNTRAYSLATDLVRMHWPLVDKTNGRFITEYPEGYEGLLLLDIRQSFTGTPIMGAIRPTDGKIHLNCAPTSSDNGLTYTYQYDKDTVLTTLTDNVPFDNAVYRAMIPVWAQLWKRDRRSEQFDAALFKASLGRAARLVTQDQQARSWNPQGSKKVSGDWLRPFER